MVKETELYDVLGISPSASQDEMRRAYRKLSMKYHPDRNPDPETADKFKSMTAAYEILSDEEKRSTYDRYGKEGLEGGGGGGGGMSSLFEMFMGGGGGGRRGGKRRGDDLQHSVPVTLEELYKGKSTKLALQKNIICKTCNGVGGKGEPKACKHCRGMGVVVMMMQNGPFTQQVQQRCPHCRGEGSTIAEKDKCTDCSGRKIVQERKVLEVYIDPGMRDGQKITFAAEGDQAPDTTPGDIILILKQKPHEWKRDGSDLIIQRSITLLEALTGFSFIITHLDGRELLIKSKEGEVIKPGDIRAVEGEGMPVHKNPYEKGRLFIVFKIEFPEEGSLSEAQATQLAAILPNPPPLPSYKEEEIEECTLTYIDPRSKAPGADRSEAYDEDEDDGMPGVQFMDGGSGASCRQQ